MTTPINEDNNGNSENRDDRPTAKIRRRTTKSLFGISLPDLKRPTNNLTRVSVSNLKSIEISRPELITLRGNKKSGKIIPRSKPSERKKQSPIYLALSSINKTVLFFEGAFHVAAHFIRIRLEHWTGENT